MSRFAMCPRCGHRLSRVKDWDGNWDGESYVCEWCVSEFEQESEDSIPEGCLACGGPYPDCIDSCNLFDD